MKRLFAVAGFALALATLCAPAAIAGPFGFDQGYPFSKLKIIRKVQTNVYLVKAPTPNSEFDAYSVYATPNDGVCQIVAAGKDHPNDEDGTTIKARFNTVKANLGSKYGTSEDADFLDEGATWNESSDYAMALSTRERSLWSSWSPAKGGVFPAGMASVALEARASDRTTTFLALTYEFSNYPKCKSGVEKTDKSTL